MSSSPLRLHTGSKRHRDHRWAIHPERIRRIELDSRLYGNLTHIPQALCSGLSLMRPTPNRQKIRSKYRDPATNF